MPRPDLRPMRSLPGLEPHRAKLEKCVFCPKLCRSACPVSNAEPRETITPWGKMSLAWMAAHGDVPLDASHAAPAWACTGCYACREACDHGNMVAGVLLDARAALTQHGVAPEAAMRSIRAFADHDAKTRETARALASSHARARSDARVALLVGCGYLRHAKDVARDAVDATAALSGQPVSLVDSCCGLPLLHAGATSAFVAHARALADSLSRRDSVVVVDAGCALALRLAYPFFGIHLAPRVELLVERAAANLTKLARVEAPAPRYHDPCQLGRGLGIYDEPRAVLARICGRAPSEFNDAREHARCSGAGGALPLTMPEVSATIAQTRVAEHVALGGGTLVTACASSLRSFRKETQVDDLTTWIARSLPR